MNNKTVNLFLIGGMKCGSTTLHDYLAEHPEIFMSADKEPGFFVPEIWNNRTGKIYDQLFKGVSDEKYIGESSTHYSKLPTYRGVTERIYRYSPDARIIYIVRHPVKRTISHYLHNRRDLYLHAESRSIMKALEQNEIYMAYSDYATQIRPYYEIFGRERVLLVLFEELITSPETVLKGIFQWLGVDDTDLSIKNKRSNAAPEVALTVRGFGMLNKLRYSSLWNLLSPLLPKRIKCLGNKMAEKKEVVTISTAEKDEVYRKFRAVYQAYVRDLEALTGRSFALWKL